jgi:hypothetical protein
MLVLPLLVAFVPAAIMFMLRPRWAIAWIVLLWASYFALQTQLDLSDDPAFMSYAMIFGFFVPVNAFATVCRLFLIVAEAREKRDAYLD